jgi:Leucyl aminopeptidase
MGALLAVAQGSVRPPRVVVMKWNGGKDGDRPAVFIGKGLVFDSGGISIKPAAGMEDMKPTWAARRPSPACSVRWPAARPR